MASPEPRTPASRLAAITRRLQSDGRIDVTSLADELGVAPETVRRDLRTLERDGQLVRVHGGAVPAPAQRGPVAPRAGTGDPALATVVWGRLPRTGTLLIGGGAQCTALAEAIVAAPPTEAGLQVVTCSLDVAVLLSRVAQIPVFNIGGRVSPDGHVQLGDWALAELGRLHVDVAVLAPFGVAPGGLSENTPAAAAVSAQAVAVADRVIVLADADTAGRTGYVRFAETNEVELIMLGSCVPAAVAEALAAEGPEVNHLPLPTTSPSRA